LLPEHVDGGDLVTGMGDLLDRTLGERIKVVTRLADGGWPVFVDAHQLENAILNLAVNARDAMDGEGTLTISTSNVRLAANEVGDVQAGDYLRISVADTGSGMSKEVRERAFEPFFTTKEVGKGTGLGLSVSYGIIKKHGGRITVDSTPGRGSTFSVILPVNEEPIDG
jgi:signal transduction histidine kinase